MYISRRLLDDGLEERGKHEKVFFASDIMSIYIVDGDGIDGSGG